MIKIMCIHDMFVTLQDTVPEYASVTDNCTYSFVWSVRAACPTDVQPVVGENCAVTDPTSGMMMLHCISCKCCRGFDDSCQLWLGGLSDWL